MIFLEILVLAVFLAGMAAMFVFPVAAVVVTVVLIVLNKGFRPKILVVPGLLLGVSAAAWILSSLLTNGPGYFFHHDFGSKVYNEGYIIPHYEDMYGETLELVDKQVIDSCHAVYTLKSGLTGDTFTAESSYYDTCSGSFDRLHLTEDYGSVLGKRLERGETVSLPFDEGYSVDTAGGNHAWFMIFTSRDGYRITCDGGGSKRRELEFSARVEGDRFRLKLEQGDLVLEVPVEDDVWARHVLVEGMNTQ